MPTHSRARECMGVSMTTNLCIFVLLLLTDPVVHKDCKKTKKKKKEKKKEKKKRKIRIRSEQPYQTMHNDLVLL